MNDELHDDPLAPTPRRPRRWVSNLGWLVGGALLAVLLIADPLGLHPVDGWLHGIVGRWHGAPDLVSSEAPKQLWTCGMHPQVIQDHPGTCPICGMNLVPLDPGMQGEDESSASAGSEKSSSTATRWIRP